MPTTREFQFGGFAVGSKPSEIVYRSSFQLHLGIVDHCSWPCCAAHLQPKAHLHIAAVRLSHVKSGADSNDHAGPEEPIRFPQLTMIAGCWEVKLDLLDGFPPGRREA